MQIHRLADLPASLYRRVGGKAAHLAELLRAGLPVPDGVVLLFARHETAGPLPALPLPDAATYAVRSSAADEDGAAHSFAGIHDTVLNVAPAGMADAVARCLQSMQSATALAYRQAHRLPPPAWRAVLIQPMIDARTAGVVFTTDPVSGQPHLVINAAAGLGDAVVGGTVQPVEMRLDRDTLAVLGTHAPMPPPGTPIELDATSLARLALRVERYFGATQDIEWCYDGRDFWILQARPIPQPEPWRFPPPTLDWTRANLREVLPDLTSTQALSALIDILGTGLRRYYGRLLPSEAEIGPAVHIFKGRPYFNLSMLRHMCYVVGMRPLLVLHSLGHDAPPTVADTQTALPPLRRLLAGLPDLVRLTGSQLFYRRTYHRQFERQRRFMARMATMPPAALSDAALAAQMQDWGEDAIASVQTAFVAGSMMTMRALLLSLGISETVVLQQLAAGPKTVSAQQGFELLALAHQARHDAAARAFCQGEAATPGPAFASAWQRFLDTYGHRALYESDWARPRFSEDPSPLLFSLRAMVEAPHLESPDDIIRRQQREAAQGWRSYMRSLHGWKRLVFPPLARRLIADMAQLYVLRERHRFEMVRGMALLRAGQLDIARRFVARGWLDEVEHFFDLAIAEVVAALQDASRGSSLRAAAAASRAQREEWSHHDMPLTMRLPFNDRESGPPLSPAHAVDHTPDGGMLRGLCVSPGTATGRVRVLHSPLDFERMRWGEILVAPATDPSWTPLFTMAAGVIVEIGGSLSHASTIAREYGLPALTNVRDATRLLRDGDYVRLDATAGTVEKLNAPGPSLPTPPRG